MRGRVLVAGAAGGSALVLAEPLSVWGGLDPETGLITDRHHPQRGRCVSGRVRVMPGGRGSSSSSTTLAETVRLDTAPAGIILGTADHILLVGALVAAELYGRTVPIVQLDPAEYAKLETGRAVTLARDGTVAAAAADAA